MCFSIPARVTAFNKKGYVVVEGGKRVMIDKDIRIKPGDYVRVIGDVAVDILPAKQGLQVRKLIRSLEETYE